MFDSSLPIPEEAIGGLLGTGNFHVYNGLCFLVWLGLLNRVALLQAFGLINSVCHRFGTRPFRTRRGDKSVNSFVVAPIIVGEGWHNNHHAYPRSARHGFRWYQIDVAWYFILLLQRLGLASDVRVPRGDAMRGDAASREAEKLT